MQENSGVILRIVGPRNESLEDVWGELSRTVETRERKIDHLGDRPVLKNKVRSEVEKRETVL